MEFIEATVFTRHVYEYLSEDEYLVFQRFLLMYPQAGKVVPGSGGVRKIAGEYRDVARVAALE